MDDLIQALGCDGISSSQCRASASNRWAASGRWSLPLGCCLDGLTQQVREGGRVNVCVSMATGDAEGQHPGYGRGRQRDGAFWLAFLRS